MQLDLTGILRCPADHDQVGLVCVPLECVGRHVVRGVIGCPVCGAEYPIRGGVANFAGPAAADRAAPSTAGAADLGGDALAAFLDLHGGGGYVLLVGSAARLAADLAALVPGVHIVGLNAPPPPDTELSPDRSSVACPQPGRIPVMTAAARGVVLGAECSSQRWLAEGARVLLPGRRLVAEDERASPDGIVELARGAGVFVGERRA